MNTEILTARGPREIRAARGTSLRCQGWSQEGLLRLLENTLENAERPEELIVYGGTGQAARDWDSLERLVECLSELAADETLVVQSGKPVAIFRTSVTSPRVVIANTNLVGQWATWETFYNLRDRGLIMYGQYTAGDWQYIGQQGVLQSTYETLAACARANFDDSLTGRIVLTSGLGAMGGAQPLAVKLLGGIALVCEVDVERAERRIAGGYLDELETDIDSALATTRKALEAGEPRSIGLIGNAAELLPQLLERGFDPDIVTDQTSAHDLRYGYIPHGFTLGEASALRLENPAEYERAALASIREHVRAMLGFLGRGAVVFEYGNAIRQQAVLAGVDAAFDIGGFVPLYIRPSFCIGRGPCRWITLSGDVTDLHTIDDAMLEFFADDESVTSWIKIAKEHVPVQGLPARTSWLDYRQRLTFASLVNRMVRERAVSAPVAMTRDHLDTGSVAQPTRETEGMIDGSDAVADWPVLNALLNTAGGADLVALHQGAGSGMGGSISAGVTLIIDGTKEAEEKLQRVLRTDAGIGVIRHADAGYESAQDTIETTDLRAPMLQSRTHI